MRTAKRVLLLALEAIVALGLTACQRQQIPTPKSAAPLLQSAPAASELPLPRT